VIMAQIGSFVPAKFASLRLVDKLFTRIGTSDSIETNSSSFMVEMQETAHIVNHATERYATCDMFSSMHLSLFTETLEDFSGLSWNNCVGSDSPVICTVIHSHMHRHTDHGKLSSMLAEHQHPEEEKSYCSMIRTAPWSARLALQKFGDSG